MNATGLVVDTPPMPTPHVREREAFGSSGPPVLGLVTLAYLAAITLLIIGIVRLAGADDDPRTSGIVLLALSTLLLLGGAVLNIGLIMVAPGEARVLQFLGRYVGTVRMDGLRFVNPFTVRRRISTRIRNHETAVTKVNDADGNPIEIAAVVVWRITDTARAVFEVDDYDEFVTIQAETAVRHIATSYPYDDHADDVCRCAATPTRSPSSSPPRSACASSRPGCGSWSPG